MGAAWPAGLLLVLLAGCSDGVQQDSSSVAPGSAANVGGTEGDDRLEGTPSADRVRARGGDDVVWSYGGDDVVRGHNGADQLHLGAGNDRGCGGPGADVVFGGAGNDSLYWYKCSFGYFPASFSDMLHGGPGRDRLYGLVMYGGGGADHLIVMSEFGGVRAYAGPGDDRIDIDDDMLATYRDVIRCGKGFDTVQYVYRAQRDPADRFIDCERVLLGDGG